MRKLREAVFDALASQRVGEKDPVFRQAAANFFTKLTSFNTINFLTISIKYFFFHEACPRTVLFLFRIIFVSRNLFLKS